MSDFTAHDVVSVLHGPNWFVTYWSSQNKIERANQKDDFSKIKQIIDAVLGHKDKPHIEFKKREAEHQ